MKRGDLVQFRLNFPWSNGRERPWSDPALVMYQEDAEGHPAEVDIADGLWIVFMKGHECVIDESNYEIQHLTNALQVND